MQTISTSPFNLSMLRKHNIWYTMKDGNWSDPAVWISNGTKKYTIPQPGDDVYVNHVVTMDIASIHIHNLYISGKLSGASLLATTIIIDGDCQVSGSGLIDLSLQFNNLILNGYNNIIPAGNFIAGNYSTVTYNGIFDQFLLSIPYKHLTTYNGNKYQNTDITTFGNFNANSNYEVGSYNLTVNGTSTLGATGTSIFSKSGPGNILFVGYADFEGVNMPGNPNVELRGGMQIHGFDITPGTGVFTYSTNNQNIDCLAYLGGIWNASIVIQGAITVTLTGSSSFQVNNTINGTVSGSTFNNTGKLYLGNNSTPMTTGVLNYQYSSTSTLGYAFNGSCTLPYANYANLYIGGTGTKTLGANTVINQGFINNGSFECNGYNVTVTGAFTNSGDFTANAFSTIIFIGAVEMVTGGSTGFDLTTGNPNVEFRGGWDVHSASSTKTGTGIYSFTTNNQTISFSAYNNGFSAANFLISGAITVIFTSGGQIPLMLGTLNGDNALSTFYNQGTFAYNNAQGPMQTGVLNCNSVTNTFIYSLNGNQDITAGIYKNLTLSTGGAKRLLGNVSVINAYTLSSSATLNSNTYSLTNP